MIQNFYQLLWHLLQELSGHRGSLEEDGRQHLQVISYRICTVAPLSKGVSFCIYINVEGSRGRLPFIVCKK